MFVINGPGRLQGHTPDGYLLAPHPKIWSWDAVMCTHTDFQVHISSVTDGRCYPAHAQSVTIHTDGDTTSGFGVHMWAVAGRVPTTKPPDLWTNVLSLSWNGCVCASTPAQFWTKQSWASFTAWSQLLSLIFTMLPECTWRAVTVSLSLETSPQLAVN